MEIQRTGEINVTLTSSTSADARRILQTAYNLLQSVEGLEINSMYIVREQLVPKPEKR